MAVHAALTDPAKVVAVLRIGAGKILSKHYEYFQTLNLGANNFLRGFRKDRFSGTSLSIWQFGNAGEIIYFKILCFARRCWRDWF